MNVIIGFENGQVITASGCAGFEVHAGGDICVLRKNDGSKLTYNFRKILYICEDRALDGVGCFGGSGLSGAASVGSGLSGGASGGSGSGGSGLSGAASVGSDSVDSVGSGRKKTASGKK